MRFALRFPVRLHLTSRSGIHVRLHVHAGGTHFATVQLRSILLLVVFPTRLRRVSVRPKPNATHTLLDDLKSNASVVRRKLVSRMVFCVLLGLIVPVHIYRTSVSYA